MLLFFLFALSVIFGVNIYLFVRGWQVFPPYLWIRILYTFVFILAIACFFLRMYYGDKLPERVTLTFSAVGFTWLVTVFYLALYALSIDIVRIANHFFHFLPDFINSNYQFVKLTLAISGIIIVSIILAIGNYNFNHPIVRNIDLAFDCPQQNKEIKIVLASDMHLSSSINRENLSNIISGLDRDIPKILLDHQPVKLEEAQQNGVDLQLSGHTHNGQFWPGNLVVRRMFEVPTGYRKIGRTQYYTSSGIGLWGPKYRIGTVSEIVVFNVKY